MAKNKQDKEIRKIRDAIDSIDGRILSLITKRADHAFKIGQLKSKDLSKNTFYKPEREAAIISKVLKNNESKISNNKIRAIYKELISACLSLEESLKVGYLGPEGTHSEAAVHFHFGSSAKRIPATTIEDVFYQTMNKETSLGVVPVENSSEGVVNSTLNCLADNKNIKIVGEIFLNISHQLACSNQIKPEEAFAIASHPQALGQCNKWIERNCGSIKRLEMPSSAEAAKYARENKNILCIVNNVAIERYKLKLIKENIQDFDNNKTRFLVIGMDDVDKTGSDKTSLLIQTKNNPGALMSVLRPFETGKINLSKIETRPSRGNVNSHEFFVDCEGHIASKALSSAIKNIQKTGAFVRVLGSYPQFL